MTHRGKETPRGKEAHAVDSTSHRADKLPSFPPATMLPLNSTRRVGMTNSSLYPPKINHSTELEWDTGFSRMKNWAGGWNIGNILRMSQVAWAGDQGTTSPNQTLLWELSGQSCRVWWHQWHFSRFWKYALISSNRSLIDKFLSFKDLHKWFVFTDHSRSSQMPCI